jgi:hypothetical protein
LLCIGQQLMQAPAFASHWLEDFANRMPMAEKN